MDIINMIVNYINFSTTMSKEECKKILEENLGKVIYNPAGGYISNKVFIGNIYKKYFTIRVAIKHLNSLSPFMIGKIVEKDGIVNIRGVFLINPGVLIFHIFFLFIVITSLYDKIDSFSITFAVCYIILIIISANSIIIHPRIIKKFIKNVLKSDC